jgi:hypothetical protein
MSKKLSYTLVLQSGPKEGNEKHIVLGFNPHSIVRWVQPKLIYAKDRTKFLKDSYSAVAHANSKVAMVHTRC